MDKVNRKVTGIIAKMRAAARAENLAASLGEIGDPKWERFEESVLRTQREIAHSWESRGSSKPFVPPVGLKEDAREWGLMILKDNREAGEITNLLWWALESPCWRSIITSVRSLRSNFKDMLEMRKDQIKNGIYQDPGQPEMEVSHA
jgi:hypothetical protein